MKEIPQTLRSSILSAINRILIYSTFLTFIWLFPSSKSYFLIYAITSDLAASPKYSDVSMVLHVRFVCSYNIYFYW